jgi:hypothetical protein
LIKAPGLYTLKRITIAVTRFSGAAAESADGFCALLPLVLRRTCKGDCIINSGKKTPPAAGIARERMLSAVDRLGIAAFIGSGGLIQRRAVPDRAGEAEQEMFCYVKIQRSNNDTGGMDVQQSK